MSQIPDSIKFDWQNSGSTAMNTPVKKVNVTDIGFANNGIIDNSTLLQNRINSHQSDTQLLLFFPAGSYKFSKTIYLKSNITLAGEGATKTKLIFDNSGTGNLFEISASQSSSFNSVKGTLKIHSKSILTDSELTPNTYYELLVDGSGLATSSWAMNSIAQLFKVDSIKTTTSFISSELKLNYDQLTNPRIRKIIPIQNVHFQFFKLERLDKTTGQTNNFNFSYTTNCTVMGVESFKSNMSHLTFSKSYRNQVSDCYFHHAFDYGGGGKAYGVELSYSASNCLVENNIFDNLRHSVLLQSGANGNVISGNYSINPFWSEAILPANSAGELVLHGNYPFANLFEGNQVGNIVVDNSHGFNGPGNVFYRNRAELWGIFMNADAGSSTHFLGNENTGNFNMFSGTGNTILFNYTPGADTSAFKNSTLPKSFYTPSIPNWWPSQKPYPCIGLLRYKPFTHIPAKYRYSHDSLRALNRSSHVFIANLKPTLKKINNQYSCELESKVQVNVVNLVLEKFDASQTKWVPLTANLSNTFLFQSEIIKENIVLTNEMVCFRWKANGIQNQEWTSDSFCINNTSATLQSLTTTPHIAYPNPFTDFLILNLAKPSLVRLYDMVGQQMISQNFNAERNILHLMNIKPATYVLEIFDGTAYYRQLLQKK